MSNYRELHEIFNRQNMYSYPYNMEKLSNNGIYILFEKGEKFELLNRVVRIGSHTGQNRLIERINEHFLEEDHRNSIFRKHIGRCFLTIDKKFDYIKLWDLKIKRTEDRIKNLHKINLKIEEYYEDKVSKYIRENISFIIIPNILDDKERLRLENGLIATFAQSIEKTSSKNWLGNYHPDEKIKLSKIWNIRHIYDNPLNGNELEFRYRHLGRNFNLLIINELGC